MIVCVRVYVKRRVCVCVCVCGYQHMYMRPCIPASASVMGLGYSKKSDPQPPASHVTSSNDFTNSCSDVDTGLSVASSGDATYSLEVVACRVRELSDGE